jgi:hypothetical protein
MHKADQRCTDLITLTANSLSGGVITIMLVAVQKDNLEVSINHAIKRCVLVDNDNKTTMMGVHPIQGKREI